MNKVQAMMVGCFAGMAACVAGAPGYLPQAGPAALRFAPERELACAQARQLVASWPALPPVTPKRVDPSETNLASASLVWPTASAPETNAPPGAVVSTSAPQAQTNPFLDLGLWQAPEGGWWQLLTNTPATAFTPHGQTVIATPLPPQAFTPPVSAGKSRATYSTGP